MQFPRLSAALDARIPTVLTPVSISDAEIHDAETPPGGLLHLFLVMLDSTVGLFGSRTAFITISSRTALRLVDHQNGAAHAPLWALALGAFLEAVDPGHLNAALRNDAARNLNALGYLAPAVFYQSRGRASSGNN
jgi:hypothetical protein